MRLAELGFRVTALGAASVTPATQANYLEHLERLLTWLMLRRAPVLDKDEWDVLLTSYIEYLYDSGSTENAGGTTLAAVRWAEPAIPRPLRRGLPLASAALAGWRRAEPGRTRPPMPREVAIAIALDLCDYGSPSLGFFVMLVFETCMRPSEALALQRFQLVPPGGIDQPGTQGCWAVLIRALELGRPGKTGDFDGSVSIDLPRHRLLVPGPEETFRMRGDRGPVFLFDYVTLLKHWRRAACRRLGLEHLHLTPYCLRHGGASEDRASNSRPMLEVMKRGGWKTYSSLARYEKHARLGLMLQRAGPAVVAIARRREPELTKLFLAAWQRPAGAPGSVTARSS